MELHTDQVGPPQRIADNLIPVLWDAGVQELVVDTTTRTIRVTQGDGAVPDVVVARIAAFCTTTPDLEPELFVRLTPEPIPPMVSLAALLADPSDADARKQVQSLRLRIALLGYPHPGGKTR